MLRAVASWVGIVLGTLVALAGAASIFFGEPHPELATLGVGLVLATGMVGKLNGNGKKKG